MTRSFLVSCPLDSSFSYLAVWARRARKCLAIRRNALSCALTRMMIALCAARRRFVQAEVPGGTLKHPSVVHGPTENSPRFLPLSAAGPGEPVAFWLGGARKLSPRASGRTLVERRRCERGLRGNPFGRFSSSSGVARGSSLPDGGLLPGWYPPRTRGGSSTGVIACGTMAFTAEPEPEDLQDVPAGHTLHNERLAGWSAWFRYLKKAITRCDWKAPDGVTEQNLADIELRANTSEQAALHAFSLLAQGSDMLSCDQAPTGNPSQLARAFARRRSPPDGGALNASGSGRKLIVVYDEQFKCYAKSGRPDGYGLGAVLTGERVMDGYANEDLNGMGFDTEALAVLGEGLEAQCALASETIAENRYTKDQVTVLVLWSGIDQFDDNWRHLDRLTATDMHDAILSASRLKRMCRTLTVVTGGGRKWKNHGCPEFAEKSETLYWKLREAGILCTRGIELMRMACPFGMADPPMQQWRAQPGTAMRLLLGVIQLAAASKMLYVRDSEKEFFGINAQRRWGSSGAGDADAPGKAQGSPSGAAPSSSSCWPTDFAAAAAKAKGEPPPVSQTTGSGSRDVFEVPRDSSQITPEMRTYLFHLITKDQMPPPGAAETMHRLHCEGPAASAPVEEVVGGVRDIRLDGPNPPQSYRQVVSGGGNAAQTPMVPKPKPAAVNLTAAATAGGNATAAPAPKKAPAPVNLQGNQQRVIRILPEITNCPYLTEDDKRLLATMDARQQRAAIVLGGPLLSEEGFKKGFLCPFHAEDLQEKVGVVYRPGAECTSSDGDDWWQREMRGEDVGNHYLTRLSKALTQILRHRVNTIRGSGWLRFSLIVKECSKPQYMRGHGVVESILTVVRHSKKARFAAMTLLEDSAGHMPGPSMIACVQGHTTPISTAFLSEWMALANVRPYGLTPGPVFCDEESPQMFVHGTSKGNLAGIAKNGLGNRRSGAMGCPICPIARANELMAGSYRHGVDCWLYYDLPRLVMDGYEATLSTSGAVTVHAEVIPSKYLYAAVTTSGSLAASLVWPAEFRDDFAIIDDDFVEKLKCLWELTRVEHDWKAPNVIVERPPDAQGQPDRGPKSYGTSASGWTTVNRQRSKSAARERSASAVHGTCHGCGQPGHHLRDCPGIGKGTGKGARNRSSSRRRSTSARRRAPTGGTLGSMFNGVSRPVMGSQEELTMAREIASMVQGVDPSKVITKMRLSPVGKHYSIDLRELAEPIPGGPGQSPLLAAASSAGSGQRSATPRPPSVTRRPSRWQPTRRGGPAPVDEEDQEAARQQAAEDRVRRRQEHERLVEEAREHKRANIEQNLGGRIFPMTARQAEDSNNALAGDPVATMFGRRVRSAPIDADERKSSVVGQLRSQGREAGEYRWANDPEGKKNRKKNKLHQGTEYDPVKEYRCYGCRRIYPRGVACPDCAIPLPDGEREARLQIMSEHGWELSPAIPLLLSWTFFCRAVVIAKKTLGEDGNVGAIRNFVADLKWYHILRQGGIAAAGDMADSHSCSVRHDLSVSEFLTNDDLPTEVEGDKEMRSLNGEGVITLAGLPVAEADANMPDAGGDPDADDDDGMGADYGG